MTANVSINQSYNNSIKEQISANQEHNQTQRQRDCFLSGYQQDIIDITQNNNEIYFRQTFKTEKKCSIDIKIQDKYNNWPKVSKESKNKIIQNLKMSRNSVALPNKQGNAASVTQLGRMKNKIKHLQNKIDLIASQADQKETKFNKLSKITQYSMQSKQKPNNSIISGAINFTMKNFYPLKIKTEQGQKQKRYYKYQIQEGNPQQELKYPKGLAKSGIRKRQFTQPDQQNFKERSKYLAINPKIKQQYNADKPQELGALKHERPSNLPKICENPKNYYPQQTRYQNNRSNFLIRQKNSNFFPFNGVNMNPHQQIITELTNSKRYQKSLGLKGINKIRIQDQTQVQTVLDGQQIGKIKRLKTEDYDRTSQSSFKTGKKIYQIAFGVRKVNLPDETQDPQQNIKIPLKKDRILQPIKLSEYIVSNTPTIQMTPQQLTQIGSNAFQEFGVIVTQKIDFKMVKYKNCIIYSIPKLIDKHILWHYNGKFYFGDWIVSQASDGQKTGEGFQYVPNKYVYKGQFFKNKRNGTGKIMYNNGNIYEGQWLQGQKHGNGKLYEKQTEGYYDGQWKNNKRDGYGLLIISDNEYYAGTFSCSIKQGFGIEKFSNGDQYKGEYFQSKFHGKGKYRWRNGAFYEGKFQLGKRNGFGIWRSAMKGGQMYMGNYRQDKKQGQGKYVWQNGSFFQGHYLNDVKHGPGRLVDDSLKQTRGVWKHGKLIETDGNDSDENSNIEENYYNIQKESKKFEISGTFQKM